MVLATMLCTLEPILEIDIVKSIILKTSIKSPRSCL